MNQRIREGKSKEKRRERITTLQLFALEVKLGCNIYKLSECFEWYFRLFVLLSIFDTLTSITQNRHDSTQQKAQYKAH
jgi:hypothetical protein